MSIDLLIPQSTAKVNEVTLTKRPHFPQEPDLPTYEFFAVENRVMERSVLDGPQRRPDQNGNVVIDVPAELLP